MAIQWLLCKSVVEIHIKKSHYSSVGGGAVLGLRAIILINLQSQQYKVNNTKFNANISALAVVKNPFYPMGGANLDPRAII
jgi:hypothetical protein